MTWRRFMFKSWLTHVVPAELERGLLADLRARGDAELTELPAGYDIQNPATIDEWALNLGGMAHVHEPVESFTWAGLALEVPSSHLGTIANELRKLPVRRFADRTPYLKLKLWMHATVMTPSQAADLLRLLVERAAVAAERARLFQEALIRGIEHGVS